MYRIAAQSILRLSTSAGQSAITKRLIRPRDLFGAGSGAQAGRLSARVAELAEWTASPNWDDEGADPIPAALWRRALQLCNEVRRNAPDSAEPFLSPSADTTVVISWTVDPSREVVLELGDELTLSIRDADGGFDARTLEDPSEALAVIRDLVR